MTGIFTEYDPQRCKHYARFFAGLSLTEANLTFWILFAVVLGLMCISALQHHKSVQLTDAEKGLLQSEVESPRYQIRIRRLRIHYLSIVSLCFILSIMCIVMEAFAAFNIEYCDGEDLMQLYWGFWSVMQIGSMIAILGVMLQFWLMLQNVGTPSWAVALGTPVLVIAAIGWVFRKIWKTALDRCKGKRQDSPRNSDEKEDEESKQSYIERWLNWAPPTVNEPLYRWSFTSKVPPRQQRISNLFASRVTTAVANSPVSSSAPSIRRTSTY